MKIICITLFYFSLSISNILLAQTYNFTSMRESVSYISSQGDVKYLPSEKIAGAYKVIFGVGADSKRTQYFTLYHNGVEQQWFGLLDKLSNVEKQGKVFSQERYAATSSNEMVTVMFAMDKSKFAIIFQNKVVEYSN